MLKTALFALKTINEKWRISFAVLDEMCLKNELRNSDALRAICALLTEKGYISTHGSKLQPVYVFGKDCEGGVEFIKATYSENKEKQPAQTEKYHSEYGFDRLVSSVSKWIDHEGITQREYNIDRLWLGRYIDFLDKAREYIAWLSSDQAIAAKKLEAIKNHNKTNKK